PPASRTRPNPASSSEVVLRSIAPPLVGGPTVPSGAWRSLRSASEGLASRGGERVLRFAEDAVPRSRPARGRRRRRLSLGRSRQAPDAARPAARRRERGRLLRPADRWALGAEAAGRRPEQPARARLGVAQGARSRRAGAPPDVAVRVRAA